MPSSHETLVRGDRRFGRGGYRRLSRTLTRLGYIAVADQGIIDLPPLLLTMSRSDTDADISLQITQYTWQDPRCSPLICVLSEALCAIPDATERTEWLCATPIRLIPFFLYACAFKGM